MSGAQLFKCVSVTDEFRCVMPAVCLCPAHLQYLPEEQRTQVLSYMAQANVWYFSFNMAEFGMIITIVDDFNLDEFNNFTEQLQCAWCCSGGDVTNRNGCVSSSAFDSFTPVIYVLRAALFCLLESREITMPESCYVFSLQFFLIDVWYSSWNDTFCTI